MYYNVGSPGSSLKLQWHIVMRPPGISRSHYKGTTWTVVELGTLSFDDGSAVVLECRHEVLDTYHIQGVNIEIRESRITRPADCRFVSKLTLHLMVVTPQAS